MSIRIDGTNTTANPGITGGDADTGLQFGTDEVSIVTGGTARVTVDSTGGLDAGAFTVDGSAPADSVNLDSSGRLLVGTSSSRAFVGSALNPHLQIEGTNDDTSIASITRNSNNTGSGRLIFGKSRGTTNGAVTGVQSDDNLGSILFEGADGTDTTTAAAIDCAVDGTPGANDMPGKLVFSTTADGASTPTERMRIDSAGSVVLASASAFVAAYIYNATTASPANVNVDASGFLRRSTSSIKYKENVQDATHGLTELLQLRSVTYTGKSEADGATVFGGLIAEEVDAAGLSEFVQYAEDGSPDALAYGNMVSLCVKAIQEQQAVIEELQAKVAALETRLTALEGGAS